MKGKTHDLNHDLTFSAQTINCVCHSIMSIFRGLGMYNFAIAANCKFASILEYSAFYEFSVLPFYRNIVFYDIKHESSLENLHCVINRSESNKTLYIWWNEGAHR